MTKLLEAAKAAKGFVESMRVPQDKLQAAIQIHSGRDMLDMLDAAIAAEEQRLADEQLPATREWLTEVLGNPTGSYGDWRTWVIAESPCRVVISVKDENAEVWLGTGKAIQGPTRRQVLCLLEAMGVKQ